MTLKPHLKVAALIILYPLAALISLALLVALGTLIAATIVAASYLDELPIKREPVEREEMEHEAPPPNRPIEDPWDLFDRKMEEDDDYDQRRLVPGLVDDPVNDLPDDYDPREVLPDWRDDEYDPREVLPRGSIDILQTYPSTLPPFDRETALDPPPARRADSRPPPRHVPGGDAHG